MKDELRPWLERAGGEYRARKKAAEKQIVRWEYASKDDRSVEPAYFERGDHARGKRLARLPAAPRWGTMAYGIDADGRCVVERQYVGPRAHNERFLAWSDDALEWVLYDSSKQPLNVCRAQLADGRIVAYTSSGIGGGWRKTFSWGKDGRLTIREEYVDENGRGYKPERIVVELEAPADPPVADLLPALEARLIAEIPARVRALRLREPAFALIVAFAGKGNDMFPPTLGVGLARERDHLGKAGVLWDVSEYDLYAHAALSLARLKKAAAPVNRLISRQDAWAAGYQSYARIAAALRRLDWSRLLPTTDDFVVFALDHDETRLVPTLREAAGARTFAAWKKKRWVP